MCNSAFGVVMVLASFSPVSAQRIGTLSQQGNTEITIDPNPLDFGRVRLLTKVIDSFRVRTLQGSVTLLPDSENGAINVGFHLINLSKPNLSASTTIPVPVLFQPMTEGPALWSDTVRTKQGSSVIEVLKGVGVYPHIPDTNLNFGKVHVDSVSPLSTITIRNIGSDTTFIYSISKSGPNTGDFVLKLDTTPSRTNAVFLDTLGALASSWTYTAQFRPSSIGPETCFVQIEIGTGITIDTLTGIGAEPHIKVLPNTLDFGTINVPTLPGSRGDLLDSLRVGILNVGNMRGLLDSLTHSDTSHFHFAFKIPNEPRSYIKGDTLADADSILGWAYFSVDSVGDFYDTLSIVNDSRYKSIQVLAAHVRMGSPIFTPQETNLDTIRDCDSVIDTIVIHNPYELRITFDSIALKGNSGGFIPLLSKVRFPINIAAGESFPITVSYRFPADSLNGLQRMFLCLYERSGDAPERVDTALFTVFRLAQLIGTYAVPPTYTPSSSDEMPFRLPIYITGSWLHRPQLDSFMISIKLDNDLVQPIGVDRTGSITEKLQGETDSVTLNWDQATRTYTVTLYGEHLSLFQDTTNTLLITILARVLVSPDTLGRVSTQISTVEPTCAARYVTGVDTVLYANDCGDQEIRSIFTHVPIVFGIQPIYPDPVDANAGSVSLRFEAAANAQITWSLIDERGEVLSGGNNFVASKGFNTLQIPSKELPSTGIVFLRMLAQNPENGQMQEFSSKFVIAR